MPKVIPEKVKGHILALLSLNYSNSMIILNMKNMWPSLHRNTINNIRKSSKNPTKSLQQKKKPGPKNKIQGQKKRSLLKMTDGENPKTKIDISKALNVSRTCVINFMKENNIKQKIKQHVHKINEGAIEKRATRSMPLYRSLKQIGIENVIFSDEKLYLLNPADGKSRFYYEKDGKFDGEIPTISKFPQGCPKLSGVTKKIDLVEIQKSITSIFRRLSITDLQDGKAIQHLL